MVLASFMLYTLVAGEQLTVSKAFTAIALFTQLQEPMTALPGRIFALFHGMFTRIGRIGETSDRSHSTAYVSMQRIEAFLREEEVPAWSSSLKRTNADIQKDAVTGYAGANLRWNIATESSTRPSDFQLSNLDVRIPRGTLTLVTGATGAGKSAFLVGLLGGEYPCFSSEVCIELMGYKIRTAH